jgi:DNA-binding XRE family transcriptional regulator
MRQAMTDDTSEREGDDMYKCVCGEVFETTDVLESHLIGLPDTDTGDHYEVTERGRAPVLARGQVDPRIAWGIRRLRIERGWTQAHVARLLGCNHTRISRIESGERGTPSPTVVADLLATTVDYLLMPCPDCGGKPPRGCQCLRCGTKYKEPS